MASVREKRKNGRIVSYQFIACLGRNEQGKQIRQYLTWTLPKGVGQKTAPKEAEKQAALWEESLKPKVEERTTHAPLTIVGRQDGFVSFVDKVWFPLQVSGNDRKEKTIQFYEVTTKIIKALAPIISVGRLTFAAYYDKNNSVRVSPLSTGRSNFGGRLLGEALFRQL